VPNDAGDLIADPINLTATGDGWAQCTGTLTANG
jgi:hypothetical protein